MIFIFSILFSHETKGRSAAGWFVGLESCVWWLANSHLLLLLALILHELRLHLLQSDLLLLLFVQVGHWLEATSANTSDTSSVSPHSPKSARHGRFCPTSGWIDIDGATDVLSGFSYRLLLRPQIDQVDELSALDPGIVRVLVLWNVSLRCFSWFILNDT